MVLFGKRLFLRAPLGGGISPFLSDSGSRGITNTINHIK